VSAEQVTYSASENVEMGAVAGMGRPRVAICHNMVTPYTNGLFNFIAEQNAIDLWVLSCTSRETNRRWSDDYSKKYSHVILRGLQYRWEGARYIHLNSGLWSKLSELKPSAVVINGIYPTMLVAASWCFVHAVPLVFWSDGWRCTMPQSIYHRIVRPFILGRCRAVICASEKAKRFFIEERGTDKQTFVAHIAPAWTFELREPGFDARPYHLVWCSRFDDATKNPNFFVEVALLLNTRIPDLRIRVIGEGPFRERVMSRLVDASIAVDHSDYIPPNEMGDVFASAKMLVLPSTREPWGLVCNEAMQCGTPCAVSEYTGVANELVVHRASGLVLDLDADLWAESIASVVSDRNRWGELSEAARRHVAGNTVQEYGREYLAGLMSVLP
jgi:glycosyltransferase involved in cell wall biosynthesis